MTTNAATTTVPPETATLSLEIEDGIGTLTLDRPGALNAIDPEMLRELGVIARWLADRAPLRALVLTGRGRAFCSGGDVTWFKRGLEDDSVDLPSEIRRAADVLHQAIIDLHRIPYPVIAAVNGPAAGAGFSLALQCDIRITSETALFACAYGRIGASPDGGMTYFLPRIVGPAKALELLLNDPNLEATAALEAGLVSEVVPANRLLQRANEKARWLGAKAPHYIRTCKSLTRQSLDNSLADHLQLERHAVADSMATSDLRNGLGTLFAGEEPHFNGR